MSIQTDHFNMRAPSPATKFEDLGQELFEFARDIDSTLAGFDYHGQDTPALVSRVGQLEARATDLTSRVETLERVKRLDVPQATLSGFSFGALQDGWQWTGAVRIHFPAEYFNTPPTLGAVNVWYPNFLVFTMLVGSAPTKDYFDIRLVKKGTSSLTSCFVSYSAVEHQ